MTILNILYGTYKSIIYLIDEASINLSNKDVRLVTKDFNENDDFCWVEVRVTKKALKFVETLKELEKGRYSGYACQCPSVDACLEIYEALQNDKEIEIFETKDMGLHAHTILKYKIID